MGRLTLACGVAVFACWLVLLAGQVWHNPLERDEGYLNAAAALVAAGRTPYLDFIFPQQPYYPLIYGNLYKLTGASILYGRVFSALLLVGFVALMAWAVRRLRGDGRQAFWAALLLAFNTLALFWYPRAKHYLPADLLLFTGFVALSWGRGLLGDHRRAGRFLLLLAGAATAGALEIRSLLAPAVIPLALAAALDDRRRFSLVNLLFFAAGGLIASLPNLYLLFQDPSDWLFNNIRLQMVTRPQLAPGEAVDKMLEALTGLLRLPEMVFLGVMCLAGLAGRSRSRPLPPGSALALWMVLFLSLGFLLPRPTYRQYWVETLPYLIVAGVGPWCALLDWASRRYARPRALFLALVAVFVLLGGYKAAGRIILNQHDHPVWGLRYYLEYRDYLAAKSAGAGAGGGDKVMLTWWPGYLVAPGVTPYPGSELGRPCRRARGRMKPVEMVAKGLLEADRVCLDIERAGPDYIFFGPDSDPHLEELVNAHYVLEKAFGRHRLYARP